MHPGNRDGQHPGNVSPGSFLLEKSHFSCIIIPFTERFQYKRVAQITSFLFSKTSKTIHLGQWNHNNANIHQSVHTIHIGCLDPSDLRS